MVEQLRLVGNSNTGLERRGGGGREYKRYNKWIVSRLTLAALIAARGDLYLKCNALGVATGSESPETRENLFSALRICQTFYVA